MNSQINKKKKQYLFLWGLLLLIYFSVVGYCVICERNEHRSKVSQVKHEVFSIYNNIKEKTNQTIKDNMSKP